MGKYVPLVERFWSRVAVRGEEECWNWLGCIDSCGYGHIKVGRHSVRTHRIVWSLAHGAIPVGMCVLHHCDNPPCVNPKHLYVGTKADNGRDKAVRGRGKGKYLSLIHI